MFSFPIYTRLGDNGSTALAGGKRVTKDNPRVEIIGEIDELSAVLGVVRAIDGEKSFCPIIYRVQKELMNFMAELAVPDNSYHKISQDNINRIESDIDHLSSVLPAMNEFVVAGGGSQQSAFLHVARTVCRRAERRLISLQQVEQDISLLLLAYLNRLSDLLFVLSRSCESE
ncbi:MAG: cob(I)yrinic acid a,c-diamide adenosyltransferase [Planctomycetaceae bacterium]|jgi:cob(I)alamin adenosyltransferase|nr:cob(I)yrinic acid a,c-diamide adenosyltransferase [Planctomycetaceae bacterium]